jgi:hypothetical protein
MSASNRSSITPQVTLRHLRWSLRLLKRGDIPAHPDDILAGAINREPNRHKVRHRFTILIWSTTIRT